MKPTVCKHCKRVIEFDPEMTAHRDEGEWVTATALVDGDIGDNLCEANPPQVVDGVTINDPYTHEPELREYTDAELEEINRRARVVAQWGKPLSWRARMMVRMPAWLRERLGLIAYSAGIATAVSFAVGMALKAVQCYA